MDQIKQLISNSSIKTNLLRLYITIVIVMGSMIVAILLYSANLNITYNRVISNFKNYNNIYSSVNSLDKDIYLNITEQKKFDRNKYATLINNLNKSLNSINTDVGSASDGNDMSFSVEILKRTVKTLDNYIDETGLLIKNNSDYSDRENKLLLITQAKLIIKDNIQNLMALNLSYSQKRIENIKNRYNTALSLIIILFIGSIFVSITLLLLVIKSIVKNINTVSDRANKLANGDLSIEQITFNKVDEFQVLAQSFNKMKDNIKDYINRISYNEMKTSAILNNMNDCVITTDNSGKIDSCNYVTEKTFNYESYEIIGLNIKELLTSTDYSKNSAAEFDVQKLIKDSKIIDQKYQLNGVKKDGTVFPVEVGYNVVEFEGHSVKTFLIHDTSQRTEIECMKNEFVSTVSHELRTPLTSIRGALSLISGGVVGVIPDKAKELLIIANNNCLRLINLINDILDVEKIEAGKTDFDVRVFDLMPIVEQTIQANIPFAQKFSVKLELESSIENINVNIDKNRLIQVITNLMSNAVKFSHPDSVVKICVLRVNDKVRVSVTNFGYSIPKEFHSKLFQKFTQADSSDARQKGGTGLGLSISKAIVERMGGYINFTSEEEQTSFYFDLPEVVTSTNTI